VREWEIPGRVLLRAPTKPRQSVGREARAVSRGWCYSLLFVAAQLSQVFPTRREVLWLLLQKL